ncbi:hypothetical protein ACWU37_21265 (plasmid) [Photobacterium damselae subsp. damselae]|uniref:hypothetical protein n=1 Tax=Photobacterium damselae TaxID=38293 RepID=UPI001F3EEA65|nr:hypothetical protein [Photobacterium damselae]UKA12862.1 hypothetical protein IHC91_20950 [Photobacterium damselae subsp. damselae]
MSELLNNREFVIDGDSYLVSSDNNHVVISYRYIDQTTIASLTVSFRVRTPELAQTFVDEATGDDIKRGVDKMNSLFGIAEQFSTHLKQRKQPTDNKYSQFIPKYLKKN